MPASPKEKPVTQGMVRICYGLSIICAALIGLLIAAVDTNYDNQWPRPANAGDLVIFVLVTSVLLFAGIRFFLVGLYWSDQLKLQLPLENQP